MLLIKASDVSRALTSAEAQTSPGDTTVLSVRLSCVSPSYGSLRFHRLDRACLLPSRIYRSLLQTNGTDVIRHLLLRSV